MTYDGIRWSLLKSALRQLDPANAERLIAQLEEHFINIGVFPGRQKEKKQ